MCGGSYHTVREHKSGSIALAHWDFNSGSFSFVLVERNHGQRKKNLHAHRCVLTCIKEKGGSEKHQASKLVKGSGMDLFLFSDMQKFSNVGESLQKSWAFYADACFLLFGCQRMNGHIHKITSRQQSLQQRMAEPVGLTKVTERQLTENYS